MVHCEGYDAIRFMTERLEREGHIAPYLPRRVAARRLVEREATHRAISHAELVGVPIMIVHVSGPRGDGAGPLGAAARPAGLCRDLPAIHHADGRRHEGPQHGHHGREICLLAAAARRGKPAGDLGGHHDRRVPDLLVRPLSVPLRRSQGQADAEGAHLVPLGAERHSRRRDAAADPVLGGRLEGAHQRCRNSSS